MVVMNEKDPQSVQAVPISTQPDENSENWPTLEEMERSFIVKTLEKCGWKVSGPGGAAEFLNVKPTTLYSKIMRLRIKKTVVYHDGPTS